MGFRAKLSPMATPSHSDHRTRDPLHGVTLETILKQLVDRHGWETMGDRIPIRCFILNPSVKSSLTFLRKTPWARKKVEAWFVEEAEVSPEEPPLPGPSAVDGQEGADSGLRFGE